MALADHIALTNNPARLRAPAFAAITRLQSAAPGEQVLGLALALVVICESANVSLSDVIGKAVRMSAAADGPFVPHIQALRDYAAKELR